MGLSWAVDLAQTEPAWPHGCPYGAPEGVLGWTPSAAYLSHWKRRRRRHDRRRRRNDHSFGWRRRGRQLGRRRLGPAAQAAAQPSGSGDGVAARVARFGGRRSARHGTSGTGGGSGDDSSSAALLERKRQRRQRRRPSEATVTVTARVWSAVAPALRGSVGVGPPSAAAEGGGGAAARAAAQRLG